MHETTGFNINDCIQSMSLPELRALDAYLNDRSGKTTNTNKAKSMFAQFPMHIGLQSAISKLTVALSRFQELVTSDLEERYYSDDGVLDFDKLKTFVTKVLAKKEAVDEMQDRSRVSHAFLWFVCGGVFG